MHDFRLLWQQGSGNPVFLPTKTPPKHKGHIIFIDQLLNYLFIAHNCWVQGQATASLPVHRPTRKLLFFLFCFVFIFFLSYPLPAWVSKAKTQCKEQQKETCKHLG
jgi:hypothetical protein